MEVLGEFAKYAFCVLKRKRRDFERSVLKYVSIKIPALTHSGQKSRVCVNQPDRLLPPEQRTTLLCVFPTLPKSATIPTNNQPLQFHTDIAYHHCPSLQFTSAFPVFLPFNSRHQKQGVALPSLNSPERSEGDGRCWANLQNTRFSA